MALTVTSVPSESCDGRGTLFSDGKSSHDQKRTGDVLRANQAQQHGDDGRECVTSSCTASEMLCSTCSCTLSIAIKAKEFNVDEELRGSTEETAQLHASMISWHPHIVTVMLDNGRHREPAGFSSHL
jgi:hypothetical protein